jgi:Mg2+ and Co2+ transporter CorA
MEVCVAKLGADLSTLKVDIATILSNYATKADIGELRADMHKMNAEIKTWTLAAMITIIGTVLAAIFGISQIIKSAIPATQPQPIVIYAQPAPPPQAPATK